MVHAFGDLGDRIARTQFGEETGVGTAFAKLKSDGVTLKTETHATGVDTDDLLEALMQLKHDLGKYVAFQSRWLGDEEPLEGLRDALIADLRETHRGPSGTRSAVEIWSDQRRGLEPLYLQRFGEADPDWVALVDALSRVEDALPRLETADAEGLEEARRAALAVSELVSCLHRKVRALDR